LPNSPPLQEINKSSELFLMSIFAGVLNRQEPWSFVAVQAAGMLRPLHSVVT